ncbi:MAG: hypothetical protein FWG98_13025 [Candidatus Cloacimonetes bacterium]|nr:hypothetical protein [Candidatus Cloacimonadota bacterium]
MVEIGDKKELFPVAVQEIRDLSRSSQNYDLALSLQDISSVLRTLSTKP